MYLYIPFHSKYLFKLQMHYKLRTDCRNQVWRSNPYCQKAIIETLTYLIVQKFVKNSSLVCNSFLLELHSQQGLLKVNNREVLTEFFRKTFIWSYLGKMDQKWPKNKVCYFFTKIVNDFPNNSLGWKMMLFFS